MKAKEMVMIADLIGLTALAQDMQTMRGTDLSSKEVDGHDEISDQKEKHNHEPHRLHVTPGALLGPFHLSSK